MFRFKQFSIQQEKSAMKVGTDGVLLGAWTPVDTAKTILDVGTGTGVIALMLAQRNTVAKLHGVEIEQEAYKEARLNFKNSPWADRISIANASYIAFEGEHKYDLIVSNPPYYTDTFKDKDSERTLARHVGVLNFNSLLEKTSELLADNGACSFVVPFKEEVNFLALAKSKGLYPKKITRVKGRENVPFKRSLLYLVKESCTLKETELVIEIDRHVYTKEYIALTKSFYLKM
ncbi:tRNA1(Val) (adenine(37)-N6)-methyltransferase [Wenyingzhuangia sp. IMCC45574]